MTSHEKPAADLPSADDLSALGRNQLEELIASLRKDNAELQAERDRLKEANGVWQRAAEHHQDTLRHANNYGAEQLAFRRDAEAERDRYIARVKLLERRHERMAKIAAGHDDGGGDGHRG
jgi:hypothetical protein